MEAQSRPRVLDWAFDALSSLPMLAFPRCLFSIPELRSRDTVTSIQA